jgi:hypothetical protein
VLAGAEEGPQPAVPHTHVLGAIFLDERDVGEGGRLPPGQRESASPRSVTWFRMKSPWSESDTLTFTPSRTSSVAPAAKSPTSALPDGSASEITQGRPQRFAPIHWDSAPLESSRSPDVLAFALTTRLQSTGFRTTPFGSALACMTAASPLRAESLVESPAADAGCRFVAVRADRLLTAAAGARRAEAELSGRASATSDTTRGS